MYKSSTVQFFLVLFFGPFGLFYSSISNAFIMLFVWLAVIATTLTSPEAFLIALVIYIGVCFIVGFNGVKKHNSIIKEKEEEREKKHNELLAVIASK